MKFEKQLPENLTILDIERTQDYREVSPVDYDFHYITPNIKFTTDLGLFEITEQELYWSFKHKKPGEQLLQWSIPPRIKGRIESSLVFECDDLCNPKVFLNDLLLWKKTHDFIFDFLGKKCACCRQTLDNIFLTAVEVKHKHSQRPNSVYMKNFIHLYENKFQPTVCQESYIFNLDSIVPLCRPCYLTLLSGWDIPDYKTKVKFSDAIFYNSAMEQRFDTFYHYKPMNYNIRNINPGYIFDEHKVKDRSKDVIFAQLKQQENVS